MQKFIMLTGGALLVVAVFLLAFSQTGESLMEYSVHDLKEKVEKGDDIVVLDVRTTQEYNGELGHVDNSILIPVQELVQRIDELDEYRDREVAVICRTDNRSRAAASMLKEAGFQNVVFVRGGMVDWNRQFGNPQRK